MINKNKYKFVLQETDYDCGVAAVATALLNSGFKKVNYVKLSRELKLSKNGTDFDEITSFLLAKTKLVPRLFYGATLKELKKELKDGRIAMVLYQGWGNAVENARFESGHYAVVVGCERGKVHLLDPSVYEDWGDGLGFRVIDETKFVKRWVDKEKNKLIRGWMVSIKAN